MQTISKEEFEKRMLRIRDVLWNAWIDAYGLDVIDNVIKEIVPDHKIESHLVSILNHYRKLMQYDLCLSVTRMYETTGDNSLKNIQQYAKQFCSERWGKFPKVSSNVLEKAEIYRNKYLAHLDVETSAEPLTNDEMMQLLEPVTSFFNDICIKASKPEWAIKDTDLQRLQGQRLFDFLGVLQPHIIDMGE